MNSANQQAEMALQQLSITDFEPLKGGLFSILFAAHDRQEAVLTDVLALTGYTPLERQPFSIVLQTSQQTKYYPQAIYTIGHPVLGELEVFLVPLGVKGEGMQYEAVFS